MDTNEIKGEAARQGQWLRDEAMLCARRVVRSDFQTEHATDAEREALASAEHPINDPMVQDFVAWRRSLLWVSAVFIVLYAGLQVVGYKTFEEQMKPAWDAMFDAQAGKLGEFANFRQDQMPGREAFYKTQIKAFGEGNAEIIDGVEGIMLASVVLAAVCVVIAAKKWQSVSLSRKWSRIGWLIMFGVPMLVLMLPITSLMSFDHIQDKALREAQKMGMGTVFALGAFITIAPKAIALFPGIIRSSMSLKTLIPESATPGWIAAIMAPFYAIFLVLIVSVINQIHGDLLLVGGLVCFMIGPLVYVWKGEDMVRPHTPQETTTIVAGVRKQAALFTVIGTILLSIFILRLPMFSATDAIEFMAGVVGNVLLMTVVAADLILALLYLSYRQNRAFAGTELEASLDQKFQSLAEVGFTQIRVPGPASSSAGTSSTKSPD